MGKNGNGLTQWYLVVKPDQRALYEVLRERLEGSGVEVVLERRSRERRRGSFGPTMDRRQNDRRRQRPVALLSEAAPPELADVRVVPAPAAGRAEAVRAPDGAVTQPCPTCASSIELEMPRFPIRRLASRWRSPTWRRGAATPSTTSRSRPSRSPGG